MCIGHDNKKPGIRRGAVEAAAGAPPHGTAPGAPPHWTAPGPPENERASGGPSQRAVQLWQPRPRRATQGQEKPFLRLLYKHIS